MTVGVKFSAGKYGLEWRYGEKRKMDVAGLFFFKQKTADGVVFRDWSQTCALPICGDLKPAIITLDVQNTLS